MEENSTALRNLIEQVAAHETQLKNVRVTGTSKTEKKMSADSPWEPLTSATVTDTYVGLPGGNFRDERDAVNPWVDGPAPFLREVSITTFNGRLRQKLTLASGAAPDPGKYPPRGEVEAERGPLFGMTASGWRYSLYGAKDSTMPIRLSRYLDDLAGSKYAQILVTRVPQGDSFYWQATIHLKGRKLEAWSFDPDHGYALRRYERWSQDGRVAESFTVNKVVEAAPGVFYPMDVTAAETRPPNSPAILAHLGSERRTHVQISSVTANIPDLSDDVFSIDWPEGTRVEDKVAGTTFVAKKHQ